MPTEFTPFMAVIGGGLIGIASAFLLLFYGKIAGISGAVQALFSPFNGASGWKIAFLAGLLAAGAAVRLIAPELLTGDLSLPTWLIVVAGLLVGVGTTMGNGCTSGHGVCGMSRFSTRSWVATMTFMGVAVVIANVIG